MIRFYLETFAASLAIFVILFAINPAMAAANKDGATHSLGSFGYWRAYEIKDDKQPVCYMTLTARFPKNAKFHRGDALLTITHRPTESSKDVISYTAGYNFKPTSSAELTVGGQNYSLFTSQDTAWSRDAVTDHKITAAIRTSKALTIVGSPSNKTVEKLTDKFELKGADAAYHAISKACGVEVVDVKPASAKPKVAKKK